MSYISQAEGELERISGITEQTLRWNRENDKPESIAISLLADDVLRLFAGKIRNKQLQVELEDLTEIKGRGIPGQIRQVLANLVSNAVDATPVGGKIAMRALQREGETGIVVQDNWSGMTKAIQARLFEPFFSTKGDLGNGLGLYISHEVIERHKGRIELESDVKRGTTVTVRLPRKTDSAGSLLP